MDTTGHRDTRVDASSDEATTFWEKHYNTRRTNAARVNPQLAESAEPLRPGTALDLGCGAGGDTIWLAQHGWQVTGVDISTTAVRRVPEQAHKSGVGSRVTTEQHDLTRSFPAGKFDLVSAQYLHTPFNLARSQVLRSAAHALRPGGLLLIVDHGSTTTWSWNQNPEGHYPTPAELNLDPEQWPILRADMPRRQATGPAGETATVTDTDTDHILVLRRAAG